ncbi:MAG: YcfL family protein [Azoarcus sp.]|jgi:uncharacterized protein YcfL|nr:YcfL family protein [Azoarcus sp.]
MKRLAVIAVFGLACLGGVAPAQGADGGTIASKVGELGRMEYLKVSDMKAVRRDNLLRVQITVTNSSSDNQQLYYRFLWLDSDGFSVWNEGPWKPEIIYGKQDKIISVTAPTFKAADFKLEVQSPNNSTSGPHSGSTADSSPYR